MRIVRTAVLALTAAAAVLAIAPAAAQAAPARHHHCYPQVTQYSGGNYGLLNGTQIFAPIDLGLDLSHNALGLLGNAYTSGGGHGHHRHHHRHYCGN